MWSWKQREGAELLLGAGGDTISSLTESSQPSQMHLCLMPGSADA